MAVKPLPQQRGFRLGNGALADRSRLWLPDTLAYEKWVEIGETIGQMRNASSWWIADWLHHGEWTYGKKYEEASAIIGLDDGTLRNMNSVGSQFNVSRRRDALSFGHHAAVASLDKSEQDRWLDHAEAQGWSVRELQLKLREDRPARGGTRPPQAPGAAEPQPRPGAAALTATAHELGDGKPGVTITIVVTTEQAKRWQQAANALGLSTDDWILTVLDKASA